jgi:competence protein ComEA
MSKHRPFTPWFITVILLILVIIAGGIVIANGACNNPGVEITVTSPQPTPASNGEGNEEQVELININDASAEELAALPEIGEVRAQAIVDYRTVNGNFKDINDLINVKGISERILNIIRFMITVN